VTSAHILFIPGMILVGVILGFILGARATRDQANLELKRTEAREAARAARAARRAGAADAKKE
jgi:hypothetical protein